MAGRGSRREVGGAPRRPVIALLRLIGLLLQVMLTIVLLVWSVRAGEPVFVTVTGVLFVMAVVVLGLELHRRRGRDHGGDAGRSA